MSSSCVKIDGKLDFVTHVRFSVFVDCRLACCMTRNHFKVPWTSLMTGPKGSVRCFALRFLYFQLLLSFTSIYPKNL